MDDTMPMYNLKAVVNEVGLTPATLRAWERRYGLIKPKRTSGGHRLYSRRDIEMLKWLVKRQNEGVSISQAVEMWNQLDGSGRNTSPLVPATTPLPDMGGTILDELREKWLADCMTFDDLAANQTLDQAFTIAPPESICIEVLQKGLAQVGEGWYAGVVSVQQEHFASALAARRINTLLAATQPATLQGRILAACPPGEAHDFPLLLATYLLRRRGWEVIYLGANVPLTDLEETLRDTSPAMVVSAAQTLDSAASLRMMAELASGRGIPLAFGGGIFKRIPEAAGAISGHYLGGEIASVPQVVEHLLAAQPTIPIAQPISPEYEKTKNLFVQRETNIIEYAAKRLEAASINPAYLERANTSLTRLIESALRLGNINFMDTSSEWLNGLLKNRGLPEEVSRKFYSIYSLGVVHYLGLDGSLILDWLKKRIITAGANASIE